MMLSGMNRLLIATSSVSYVTRQHRRALTLFPSAAVAVNAFGSRASTTSLPLPILFWGLTNSSSSTSTGGVRTFASFYGKGGGGKSGSTSKAGSGGGSSRTSSRGGGGGGGGGSGGGKYPSNGGGGSQYKKNQQQTRSKPPSSSSSSSGGLYRSGNSGGGLRNTRNNNSNLQDSTSSNSTISSSNNNNYTTSSSSSSSLPPIIANDAITFPEVRVIDGKENLGILPLSDARLAAKKKNLDLVLFAPNAVPPVCRIVSIAEMVAAASQKKEVPTTEKEEGGEGESSSGSSSSSAATVAAAAQKKTKEIRLTARTDEHDLAVKSGRVVEFLRGGHPVKVAVSFTMSAWQREEPGRREVFSKLVRRVAEAGVGWCDPSSIQGMGPSLGGFFVPVRTPKAAADWDKVLLKLASPMKTPLPAGIAAGIAAAAAAATSSSSTVLNNKILSDERMTHISATAAAALDGTASLATIIKVLPPTEQLLKEYRSPKSHAGRKAGEILVGGGSSATVSVGSDVELKREIDGLDDVNMTGSLSRGRGRRMGGGGGGAGGSGGGARGRSTAGGGGGSRGGGGSGGGRSRTSL